MGMDLVTKFRFYDQTGRCERTNDGLIKGSGGGGWDGFGNKIEISRPDWAVRTNERRTK